MGIEPEMALVVTITTLVIGIIAYLCAYYGFHCDLGVSIAMAIGCGLIASAIVILNPQKVPAEIEEPFHPAFRPTPPKATPEEKIESFFKREGLSPSIEERERFMQQVTEELKAEALHVAEVKYKDGQDLATIKFSANQTSTIKSIGIQIAIRLHERHPDVLFDKISMELGEVACMPFSRTSFISCDDMPVRRCDLDPTLNGDVSCLIRPYPPPPQCKVTYDVIRVGELYT